MMNIHLLINGGLVAILVRVESIRYDTKVRIVGIKKRIRWTEQSNWTFSHVLLFASRVCTTQVSQCETHDREWFPTFESNARSIYNIKWQWAKCNEPEHSGEVSENLEIGVDTVATHEEWIIQQFFFTFRDHHIQFTTNALSKPLLKTGVPIFEAWYVTQNWWNVVHANHGPERA